MAKKEPLSVKAVRFDAYDSESQIPSHRDYTNAEHRSMWCTEDDYCIFALNELRHEMTLSFEQQKQRHQKTQRIDNVRRNVVKSAWVTDFVHRQSEKAAIEARQRGMENELEVLKIKMEEMTTKLTQRPALFRTKVEAVKTSNRNSSNSKSARWAALKKDIAPGAIERQTSVTAADKDAAPMAIERQSSIRKLLCADILPEKNKTRMQQ